MWRGVVLIVWRLTDLYAANSTRVSGSTTSLGSPTASIATAAVVDAEHSGFAHRMIPRLPPDNVT